MSATVKKAPASAATSRSNTPVNRAASPGAAARTPSRSSTPVNGVSRTKSVRSGTPTSARGAVRKPATSSLSQNATSTPQDEAEEDARAEAAALIQELKERLQKAETVSEEYQKQVEVLQSRLDDAHKEQVKMEERVHEEEERVEVFQNEKREIFRQQKEFEGIYETERAAAMKEREEAQLREEELHEVIQRLKESLAQRDSRANPDEEERPSRATGFRSPSRNSTQNLEGGNFAPPTELSRSNSRNNSKLLHQKDKIIESLRLELAEAQIKLVEMENLGGGRMQELEKDLLQTRMVNARLLEENESYQLLLRDQTLSGDFVRGDFMRNNITMQEREPTRTTRSKSLADELEESADEEAPSENARRLEGEVKQLADQNKALTLYINKIIERVLQHNGFETILDNRSELVKPNMDKELPLPPLPPIGDNKTSFVQRTQSMAVRPKQRAASQIMSPTMPMERNVTEDPATAPSIPLKRSQSHRLSGGYTHRRIQSDWNTSAASVVNNMYRGPPPAPSSGQMSPGFANPRNSIFGGPPSTGRHHSASFAEEPGPKASTSTLDTISNGDSTTVTSDTSPPRSLSSNEQRPGGAVMAGNKIRPLRLVQETEEAQEAEIRARKQANRTSWFGGLFGANKERRISQDYPQSAI